MFEELTFVWKIRNFSLCFHKNGEKLISPVFTTEKFGGSQWNLQLYPKGYREEDEGYISFFLGKENNDLYSEVNTVSYDLAIVGMTDSNKDLATRTIENHTFEKGERLGVPKFLKLSTLNNELKNGVEDILVVRCRIFSSDTQKRLPDCEACTEIGVDQASFLWELKFQDNSKKEASTKIEFSTKSIYILELRVIADKVKISIHQNEEDSVSSKFIKGKLSIITVKGKVTMSATDNHFFQANVKNEVWEFPLFIPSKLINPGKYIKDDPFILLCEFFASDRVVSESIASSKDNYCSNTDICPNLLREFKNMLHDKIYSDVKLKTDDDVLNAHRSVLAARSAVFAAMFHQDMIESQTSTVEIFDVDSDTLKSFLEFIYTGKVEDIDYAMAKELLLVADKYQVLTLKEKCVSFLESVISFKTVFEVLSLADLISHKYLKKTAMNFVATNSKILFISPEWLNLIQNNVKLAGEIVSNISANFSKAPKNITGNRN
ncbi:speckle-type POZ protein-like isoform X1 [Parasteatoda tepidariorum]|uniref:speckle-type POZ protein-like isoform X1 n=1 Tax=Parasteatoda tepidariorum TaxID=114398 RepID=UPI001C71EF31|nr:TD and POZ domain-containing protein 3-like isoform X1 [Parasteatoda tepidariorum]